MTAIRQHHLYAIAGARRAPWALVVADAEADDPLVLPVYPRASFEALSPLDVEAIGWCGQDLAQLIICPWAGRRLPARLLNLPLGRVEDGRALARVSDVRRQLVQPVWHQGAFRPLAETIDAPTWHDAVTRDFLARPR